MHINGVGLAVLCQHWKLHLHSAKIMTTKSLIIFASLTQHASGASMSVDYFNISFWHEKIESLFFLAKQRGKTMIKNDFSRSSLRSRIKSDNFLCFFKHCNPLFFREELIFFLPSPMHFAGYRNER